MPVTIRDVAAKAGVTPTVVSHVLHNRATSIRVGEATAERVRQAARDLGYRVNVVARGFREGKTRMIGVLHGVGFPRPRFDQGSRYFATLMDGVVDGAFQSGYSVTLCPDLLGRDPEGAMADGRFDGLVWYSTLPSEANRRMLERCTVPLVLIHATAEEFGGRFPTVICDNEQGIGLAVDHLAALRHRNIAFALERDALFKEASTRYDAFVAHIRRQGLKSSEDDLIDVHTDRSGLRHYFGEARRHTAVICASDGIAASFLEIAAEYEVRIPEDLSIVGFDSTAYCRELRPMLTSISQPLHEIARCAVELLIRSIDGEALHPANITLPCGLDIRESTTSPPIHTLY